MRNLEESLLKARQFMEHEAMNTGGGFSAQPRNMTTQQRQLTEGAIPSVQTTKQPNMNPKANMSKQAIMNSRLPDAIKQAMIDTPIPDVNPTPQLSESFIDKVSKKMNSEQYSIQGMRNASNSNVKKTNTRQIETKKSVDPIPPPFQMESVNPNSLKDVIKECLKEILEEEELLVESKNMKETLQLRVGNKVFTGTIKNVKTIKK